MSVAGGGPKPPVKRTTIGEIISAVYPQMLERYGDKEVASVATAAVVNDMLDKSRDRAPEGEDNA